MKQHHTGRNRRITVRSIALLLTLLLLLLTTSCAGIAENIGAMLGEIFAQSSGIPGVADPERPEDPEGSEGQGGTGELPSSTGEIYFAMINDNHGVFESENGAPGVERLSALLDRLEETRGEHIKIANGDIFQGTYVSATLRGLPMVEALNAMDFDCFVIGNHEFDWGLDEIEKYKDGKAENGEANFPFLGANIIDQSTGERVDWIEPYTVIEEGGIKIGIIGVIGDTLESSILTSKVKDYEFVPYVDMVGEYAAELREKGCDTVVLATHEYDEQDNQDLSALSGAKKIDAIFCGHTHQKISETVKRRDGYLMPVVQNGGNGADMVQVKITLSEGKAISGVATHFSVGTVSLDSEMTSSVIAKYQELIEQSKAVIGNTPSPLSREELGYLATNAMQEKYAVDIGIINTGGIRASVNQGDITAAEIFAVFPFENAVVLIELSGSTLRQLYEQSNGGLYFSDGFDPSSLLNGKTYKIAVIDYVYENSYYTSIFRGTAPNETGDVMRDVFIEAVGKAA